MQEQIKRTDVQNKIRFLNDNNIPYEIYIKENLDSLHKECIAIEYFCNKFFYDINNGKIIGSLIKTI